VLENPHRSDEPYESVLAFEHDPPREQAATTPVRAEDHPRARRITQAEVFATADALLVEGHRPTIDRVRVRLGRGSPNTINEHLDTWWRELGARLRDLPGQEFPQLPERVAHSLQLLWNEALKGAHETLREAVAAREDRLAQRDRELAARERHLEEERQAVAARGSALEESLALARAQLAESNQRAGALEQALRERDESLARMQQRLEQLEAHALIQAGKLEAEQAARLAERTKFDERGEATERRWGIEVDQARERLKMTEKQARANATERTRLHDELRRAKSDALEARHECKTALAVNDQLRERIKTLLEHSGRITTTRRKSRPLRRAARVSDRSKPVKTP
jgi:chromosome segregation ATPase